MTEYEDSFETPSSSETTSQTSTRRSNRHETAATAEAHEATTTHSEASATTPLPSVALAHERTTTTATTAMASRTVSQPMSHSSMEDTMSEERKRTALEAPSRAAFQQLSHFVAFGSGSAGTTPMTTPLDKPAQSTANATAKEGAHVQPNSFDEALVHTPTHVPTPTTIISTQEPQRPGLLSPMMDDHTHTDNVTAGKDAEKEEEDTTLASAEKSTWSLDQMSVISTLSQFMQKRQAAPTLPITAAPVVNTSESTPHIANEASHPVTNSTAPPLLLPPSSALSTQVARTTAATTTTTNTAQTASNIAPSNFNKPTLMSALTQLRLPDLPPSSLAPRQERPMPPLRLGEQPLIFTTDRGESHSSPNGDIPPLPSAPGTNAPATITTSNTNNTAAADVVQASQARVHELQATTEAVERLVRAFALLRGYPAEESHYEDITTSTWIGKGGEGNTENATLYSGNDGTSGRLAVATLESANAYRPGAEATVRVNEAAAEQQQQQQRRQAMRLRALARHVPSSATAQQNVLYGDPYVGMMNEVNEQLVEEVVLSCVTEMLAEAPRSKGRVTRKVDSIATSALTGVSSQPARELVTVEDFSAHGVASSSSLSRRRGWATAQNAKAGRTRKLDDAYVFAEDAMYAFAPDGGPDVPEALYQSLREALHKYVLRHVIGLTKDTVRHDGESGTSAMAPITAFFAWTLLIDLLSVCQDILASDALCDSSTTSNSSGRSVWVQYCGPPTQRMIAAAAMHCLPFEVLPTAATQNTNSNSAEATYAGRIFQLDYWVTRRAMWVIAAAITDTLRAHIVRCATVLDYDLSTLAGYSSLNVNSNSAVDPLCASPMPLFELVSSSTACDASTPASPSGEHNVDEERYVATRTHRRLHALRSGSAVSEKGDDALYFGIHSDGLQALTHAVSVLTTELMTHKENIPNTTITSSSSEKKEGQPVKSTTADTLYSDLSRCACETLCELMQDEAIRAAVARHTQEKYNKLLQERQAGREATKGLSKSEVQRRAEELRRLARAEKEVEQVVERIRQEMTVRPLTS